MNVINKTSLASGGTTEKRISYLLSRWNESTTNNDLQFNVGSKRATNGFEDRQ